MRISQRKTGRRPDGMLADSVAGLAVFIPLLVTIIIVYLQAAQAYAIATQMNRAANLAARSLVQAYKKDPSVAIVSSKQQAIFTQIRINQMVASNSQFRIPSNGWNLSATPPTVTVIVSYIPGAGDPGLPQFPLFKPIFVTSGNICSKVTYRLL